MRETDRQTNGDEAESRCPWGITQHASDTALTCIRFPNLPHVRGRKGPLGFATAGATDAQTVSPPRAALLVL